MSGARFTVRRALLLVAGVAVVVAVARPVERIHRYRSIHRGMYRSLDRWVAATPPGVAPPAWEGARIWTQTAYANICFSEQHVAMAELARLRDDLALEFARPATPAALVRVWDRMARTGPHGRQYVARFGPIFRRECFPMGTFPGAGVGPAR